ncbi:MAG: NADH-quinone oxidoreductase subunit N [Bacteroidota bacterium]|nr:NADH-quinone oxidoreductase subunit N [Bacteroidota bacterium]
MPETISSSIANFRPELALALTFIAAMIMEFAARGKGRLTGAVVLAGFAVALALMPFSPAGPERIFSGMIALDPFSVFFKYFVIVTGIVIVLFSFQSQELRRDAPRIGEYFCFIAALTFGMTLMAGAANLLMIYIAIELVGISSYILAGFTKSVRRSSEAALKYVLYGAVSSGLMLYGMSLIFGLMGSLDLVRIHDVLARGHAITTGWSFATMMIGVVLILAGLGYKISAVPFHFWTPDVYEGAPITITAFLAVASKAAGFAVLIRFFTVMFFDMYTTANVRASFSGVNWNLVLAVLSVATMTVGNFIAVWQDNLKRMLAYSSIAHAGYLLMGVVVSSDSGIAAVLLYFIMYFFMNLGAFYVVMAVADKIGSEHIDDYRGFGKRAPTVGVGFAIFLISLTGLPPTGGFVGKLILFSAVVDSPFLWLAVVAVLNTVVSLYYYARVLRNMYLREPLDGDISPIRFRPAVVVTVVLFIIPNILFGLYFEPLVKWTQASVAMLLPGA